MPASEQIRIIADRFVEWQTPYGRPDPDRCPFVTQGELFLSTHMHSPTFMAMGLYGAFEVTGEQAYKAAADRYIAFYFACLRNPRKEPDAYAQRWIRHMEAKYGPDPVRAAWAANIISWPFIFGMALAGFREFRRHNPEEVAFDSAAAAAYEWLLYWRWDEGSYFRNGYGVPAKGIIDAGNSDDICHMGRGLIGYYEVSEREDVLGDAVRLAEYYLTDVKPGMYQGCWSPEMGTWVVAPTTADGIEHFGGTPSFEMAWGFSSVGAIEYLTRLAAAVDDDSLRSRIAERCVSSMKWQFDACQFDDGACGMSGRDDKWIGMTAGAILSYLRVREAGFLTDGEVSAYRPKALAARRWLFGNITPESVESGGYFKITGKSEPRPPENMAWMLGWTLQALAMVDMI
jgi:hypothetical protein